MLGAPNNFVPKKSLESLGAVTVIPKLLSTTA